MSYTIIEQQTNENGQTAVLHYDRNNILEAESVYHTTLASAAISQVSIHSVSLLNEQGRCLKYEFFIHGDINETE